MKLNGVRDNERRDEQTRKKKSELVFKVGPREKTFPGAARDDLWGANMRDLFSGAKICPLALKTIWMRFRIFFFFLTRAPNAPARRSSVKHHFKAHQRVHSDYSDVFATLRHHTASVTTSKWRQQVPLAWTLGCHRNQKEKGKKNKKKTLCAETKPAHNSHRVEHPRCVVRGWSFKHP